MTPHIEANKNEIAPIVIMPGDPKRAEYIAKNYLENIKLVNQVRNTLAYTGEYKGKKVTIFSSGMGIPSMGIYSHELFTEYDVDSIIRVGSAGSYISELKIKDLFLVENVYSESNYKKYYRNDNDEKTENASNYLNEIIRNTSKELNIDLKIGKCHCTEAFYTKDFDLDKIKNDEKCECVEMESYSLFTNANSLNKKAACILTISDSFITNEELSSIEREKNFNTMIELALESILKIEE